MKLCMFGLSHQTVPIEIREQFSFGTDAIIDFLQNWNQKFGAFETVLVSTCNRTELYVASAEGELPENDQILRFLLDQQQGKNETAGSDSPVPKEITRYFRILEDQDVVSHLFSVISSLESMVLGEPQILSQIKQAYQLAADNGTTGPITHSVFQSALKTAKRIAAETEIFHHRVSIPSVAVVDFALQLFEQLTTKKIMVLGAGEMAEETLKYLTDYGAKSITVINRSPERAQKLADAWHGAVVPWENRIDVLAQADVVIAATGAAEPVITLNDYRSIAGKRQNRPLFMLDICVPRNIEAAIGRLPNVYLYSIDDLAKVCQKNRERRDQEIPKAQKIIAQETERFLQEIRRRDTTDIIRQLRDGWNQIKENEEYRLFNRIPDCDPKTKEEIRYAFDRLVNKLLHPPMESLRDVSQTGGSGKFLEAVKRMFRL